MRFIDRLFPFLNRDVFFENTLTSFWILTLISIFLIATIYLILRLSFLKRKIENGSFKETRKLKEIWLAYKSRFSDYSGQDKTVDSADEYFNEQTILFAYLNYRVINNVSNMLVGFGILGTFVGLTYGIADSNFETTDAIKKSINNLLAGMGTAFVTSIWGMGLSICFTLIYKHRQTRIYRKIQSLCFDLDTEFKINQKDLDKSQTEKQRELMNQLFNDYLVAETDEGKQLPKNVFRQLLEESIKQTASLQTFSDDLGTSIELAMEKLVEDNNAQISDLIEEKLIPVLEDLKAIKQDSGTQVIENAVERLADSMKSMMDDFKSSITGDTKQELEGLTNNLLEVSGALTAIPETMSNMTNQISETIEALKETVIQNIELSKNEASEQNKKTKEAFVEATTEYKSTVEDLQDHMELLLSTQKDNIKQVSNLTDKITSTLKENSQVNEQFETMLQKSKVVAQLIESISNKFENNSNALTESSMSLKGNISDFTTSISEYVNKNDELLENHKRTLDKTRDVSEAYVNRFETIEGGLKGIFDQLQLGLKDYQTTTAENLNTYLTEFSSVLITALEGVENNVTGLNEVAEELTEQVQKMRN
ncbi:MotA/TolQ/ExbB proton channel family protein [Algibacter mikhailovii]|uniref:MotA/TolQ/ExbB proton channel family protein n=1 Tax=Algibacter mikhailovii TaxID=425498 RepID=UPI002495076D|nr:MotA/TolQ/ExbB proton channel family protein [Algibacter mikhailovii]